MTPRTRVTRPEIVRPAWLTGLLLAGLGLTSCMRLLSCEDPLERERRERDEQLASSTVNAYRAVKLSLRAAPVGAAGQPAGKLPDGIAGLTPKLRQLLSRPAEGVAGSVRLLNLVDLALQLKAASDQIDQLDEDSFPTLLQQIVSVSGGDTPVQLLALGYGPAHEHLVLGLLWFAARGAPPGLVLYELEKVRPAEADPALLHLAGPLFRAIVYLLHEWPHLSELEWTAYLEQFDRRGRQAVTEGLTSPPERDLALLHLLGRMGRAKVRETLERSAEAQADLEAAVSYAEQLGVDDELVWLLGCYLALGKGDQERAGAYLAKLEGSSALGTEERALVLEIRGFLGTREPDSGLQKLRDGLFAAQALGRYARRAGPVARLESELQASQAGQRLAGLVGEVNSVLEAFNPTEQAKGLLDRATDGVKKVLD